MHVKSNALASVLKRAREKIEAVVLFLKCIYFRYLYQSSIPVSAHLLPN